MGKIVIEKICKKKSDVCKLRWYAEVENKEPTRR
jgi:hypothetical protein